MTNEAQLTEPTSLLPKATATANNATRLPKRRKGGKGDKEELENANKSKRLKWNKELHASFLRAIAKLGVKAVPSAILNEMNVAGLTRENVASHLQKFRIQLGAGKVSIDEIIASPPPAPSSGYVSPRPHIMLYSPPSDRSEEIASESVVPVNFLTDVAYAYGQPFPHYWAAPPHVFFAPPTAFEYPPTTVSSGASSPIPPDSPTAYEPALFFSSSYEAIHCSCPNCQHHQPSTQLSY